MELMRLEPGATISIHKDRIAKGHRFVLRTTLFTEAWLAAGITTQVSLDHRASLNGLFRARFSPPGNFEIFFVSSGAVPATQSAIARQFVAAEVIPQFIAWARHIAEAPRTSTIRRRRQTFTPDMSAYPEGPSPTLIHRRWHPEPLTFPKGLIPLHHDDLSCTTTPRTTIALVPSSLLPRVEPRAPRQNVARPSRHGR